MVFCGLGVWFFNLQPFVAHQKNPTIDRPFHSKGTCLDHSFILPFLSSFTLTGLIIQVRRYVVMYLFFGISEKQWIWYKISASEGKAKCGCTWSFYVSFFIFFLSLSNSESFLGTIEQLNEYQTEQTNIITQKYTSTRTKTIKKVWENKGGKNNIGCGGAKND